MSQYIIGSNVLSFPTTVFRRKVGGVYSEPVGWRARRLFGGRDPPLQAKGKGASYDRPAVLVVSSSIFFLELSQCTTFFFFIRRKIFEPG